MKKILSLLSIFSLFSSTSTFTVSCSGSSLSGNGNNNSDDPNKPGEEEPWPIVTEKSNDYKVYGESLNDWNKIQKSYSNEYEINKQVYDDLKNFNNPLDELMFYIAAEYMSWYSAIVYDSNIYIYLYQNKLNIELYESNNFESNFTNEQLTFFDDKLFRLNSNFGLEQASINYFIDLYKDETDEISVQALADMKRLKEYMANWQDATEDKIKDIENIL
ncbi:hypothetical protein [Spiroplasma endosymbiont of Labia minor]|uniref:hypothetical protein n=1 Tax=Spiroplasma endosymbiont of Labia minor TaxID=3066305 RepID=UPI0030D33BCD